MTISQFLQLVHVQASMKLKSQSSTLVLSYLWWIIEPALYVALFYFVFKFVLYRGGDDFLIFLVIGKIPFLWFSKAVTSGASSIMQNKGIINQRDIPKLLFPCVNCQESFYKQLVAFIVMLSFVVASGFTHFSQWGWLLPVMLLQYLLILGVASFFSILVTIAQDFLVVLSLFMMGLMFTSGIFWDINLIQDEYIREFLLLLNPLAAIIDCYRKVLMYGEAIEIKYLISIFTWGFCSLLFSAFVLSKYSQSLTRRLFQ